MMVRLGECVNAAGADRGRLQIGLGYVLFFLWEREKRRLNRTDDEALRRWSQESFGCGVEAARLLPDDDLLGVAFAVNHQVFVGMETEFCSDDQLTELRRKLLDHLDTKRVWNYRFADTVAMLRYRAAKAVQEQLRSTELPEERKELRDQACLALEHAAELLRRSRPYYGDREVLKHINRIHDLQIDIGCPPSRLSPGAAYEELAT